jgi:hypothetical protein
MIFLSILGIVVYVIDEIPKLLESLSQPLRSMNENYLSFFRYSSESFLTFIWYQFFFASCFKSLELRHFFSLVLLTVMGGFTASTIPDKPNPSIPNLSLFLLFLFFFLFNLQFLGCTICTAILLQNSIDLLIRGISILISQFIIQNLSSQLKKRSLKKLNEVLSRHHKPTLEEYESPTCTSLVTEYSDRTHRKVYRYMRIIALCWHISVYINCWIVYKEESIAMFVYLMKLSTLILIEILNLHTMRKDEDAKLKMIHPLEFNEFENLFEKKSLDIDDTEIQETVESCPICLSPHGAETIKLSSCGHMFHEGCILAMMRHQEDDSRIKKCPICRALFPT